MDVPSLLQAGLADMYYYWVYVRTSASGFYRAAASRFPSASQQVIQTAADTIRQSIGAASKLQNYVSPSRALPATAVPFKPSYQSPGITPGQSWEYRVTVHYRYGSGAHRYYTTFVRDTQSLGRQEVIDRAEGQARAALGASGSQYGGGPNRPTFKIVDSHIDTVFRI